MAITAAPYGKFLGGLATGVFNFPSDTIKVALTTSSYAPNIDTNQYFTDISNEITGTGYTAGGVTLSNVAFTYDSAANWWALTADPATWSGATFTMRRAVIYKSTGTGSTSPLIGYIDYGADQSPVSETFAIAFSSGVLRIRPFTG